MTAEFRRQNLIVDENVDHYDGTTAVVRTKHLRALDVEFLRWRAERWIKVRHIPAAFLHNSRFVLKHSREMLAHTFTGTTIRSLLGLETDWQVFTRYRASRQREREDAVRVGRSDPMPPLDVFVNTPPAAGAEVGTPAA